jgi:hypothetical protein
VQRDRQGDGLGVVRQVGRQDGPHPDVAAEEGFWGLGEGAR